MKTSKGQDIDKMENQRRSSSRNIKRRKFDDELVESSLSTAASTGLHKSNRGRAQANAESHLASNQEGKLLREHPLIPRKTHKKGASGANAISALGDVHKRIKKLTKTNNARFIKDGGRWKPIDDFLLIQCVLQVSDLRSVYNGVKFSSKFTLNEISQRWYTLLYDKRISSKSCEAIRNLSSETIRLIEKDILFSEEEENLVASVRCSPNPDMKIFDDLLTKNPHIFHRCRTSKDLMAHWCRMRKYNLLSSQSDVSGVPMPILGNLEVRNEALLLSTDKDCEDVITNSGEIPEFEECEQLLLQRSDVVRDKISGLDRELSLFDRSSKKEILVLENELKILRPLVDKISAEDSEQFDDWTCAVLRGRFVRYLMQSCEITIGRSAKMQEVDVDLSLEGAANRISRRQAVIQLNTDGTFVIRNEGKSCVYLNGKPLSTRQCANIENHSLIELSGMRLLFIINESCISSWINANKNITVPI